MPPENFYILVPIMVAFVAFAVVLSYGEYQTRHFKRADDVAPPRQVQPDEWHQAA